MVKYTEFSLRKPPRNVKVQLVFEDGFKDICYIDDWDIIHGQEIRIIKGKKPAKWKKIEKDEMGGYIW